MSGRYFLNTITCAMRIFLCAIIFFSLLLLSGGCSQYHYVPNNMVMPVIEKQHDAVVSYAFSGSVGREIQAVYSPFKHVALMYNDMKVSESNPPFTCRIREGSIGAYYGKYPFTLSLLGGYGQGFAENSFSYHAINGQQFVHSRLDFQQYSIQPGFVLQTRGLRFGMAFKQVWLRYNGGDVDVDNMPDEELAAIRAIEEDSPFGLTEFGLTLGFRIQPFTFSYNSVSLFGGERGYY